MSEAGHLLDRQAELARVDSFLESIASGQGAVMAIEGGPGMGKTTMCQQARQMAERAGFLTLLASGSPIESDLSFGIADQLLNQAAQTRADRVVPSYCQESPCALNGAENLHSVLAGMHAELAELASRRPTLVVVDDARWVDSASARFLLFVARRLHPLRLGMVVAVPRSRQEVAGSALAEVLAEASWHIRLEPLTSQSVKQLLTNRLAPVDPDCAQACLAATGGVPFYLMELIKELQRRGRVDPACLVEVAGEGAPASLVRSLAHRMACAHPAASKVAQLMAVLGPHGDPARLTALSGLALEEVLAAMDALATEGVLVDSTSGRFTHPIVHSSIYATIPKGARDVLHRQAACLLSNEGANPEVVASHLLATSVGVVSDLVET